ncbi:unnamed protein product [marine sediment metagenome]|uniref:Uncharacterized protein n=1 Tax=marine sediment metagenome TaxID=412755 RepID=X1JJA6_9ZZZZ
MKAGSAIIIGLLFTVLVGLAIDDLSKSRALDVANCDLKNIQENCIIVRKGHIVEDIQTYLNSQQLARYYCGEVDGVPGHLFRIAVHNFDSDELAERYMTPTGVPKYE